MTAGAAPTGGADGPATGRATGPRVAVVGGGVLGMSTAAHLVRLGARVTLVTDGPLASGASGRSLSWLNSAAPRTAAYHRLRMLGLDRYRLLAGSGRRRVVAPVRRRADVGRARPGGRTPGAVREHAPAGLPRRVGHR